MVEEARVEAAHVAVGYAACCRASIRCRISKNRRRTAVDDLIPDELLPALLRLVLVYPIGLIPVVVGDNTELDLAGYQVAHSSKSPSIPRYFIRMGRNERTS